MPGDNDTDPNKEKRRRGSDRPISFAEEKMLSIRDFPCLVMVDGNEMLAIPNGSDKEIMQILQQWEKDVHYQKISGGSVQIVERTVGGCKRK